MFCFSVRCRGFSSIAGCPGNHEYAEDFAQYTHRFRVFVGDNPSSGQLPTNVSGLAGGLPNNHFYSWEMGSGTPSGVHIVSLSTEAYFFYNLTAAQYAWLDQDLAGVDRSKTPWVIVYGHRSIYCSCDSDCDDAATDVRDGPYGLEAIFNKYKVDIWINGEWNVFVLCVGRRGAAAAAAAVQVSVASDFSPHMFPPSL